MVLLITAEKNRLELSKLTEFLSSSGNKFQTVGPVW